MKQAEAQKRVLLKPDDSGSIITVPKANVYNPNKGFSMKLSRIFSRTIPIIMLLLLSWAAQAQVNSGSNGSDGALDYSSLTNLGYSTNIVINMADHPNGIYQYTYVNIPQNVTVTFIPNANNTPVVWLVQSTVVINGAVDVSGQSAASPNSGQFGQAGLGGPGGYKGGVGGIAGSGGQGPGGGLADYAGESAAFGALPFYWNGNQYVPHTNGSSIYGNQYLVPIIGGSGGGGSTNTAANCEGGGGGGGGGAILIAASQSIQLGSIIANGGSGTGISCGYSGNQTGGGGSGGGVRLVSSRITGVGGISTYGGNGVYDRGGTGRVRFDTYANDFSGSIYGAFTQGSQFVIIPSAGQLPQLTVTSVGGVPISASPTGQIVTPDAVLSAQQNNPIPVVVSCANIPLNTQITVTVTPANGATISATGLNNTGTLSSSTATILINMQRGGGIIYATAATSN